MNIGGIKIDELIRQGPGAAITWAIVRGLKFIRDKKKWTWFKDSWFLPVAALVSVPVVIVVNAVQGKSADGIFYDAASVWILATFGNGAMKQIKEISSKP